MQDVEEDELNRLEALEIEESLSGFRKEAFDLSRQYQATCEQLNKALALPNSTRDDSYRKFEALYKIAQSLNQTGKELAKTEKIDLAIEICNRAVGVDLTLDPG